ncbi:MAG: CDP-glucose 4,6-dehydratase [Myxococcota bacterium]
MNANWFGGAYAGKRVLLTGHTGFKGSWLAVWLRSLGAEVYGLALEPDTDPALFDLLKLRDDVDHAVVDVRDLALVKERVSAVEPEVVFHLAAQPLVRRSYSDPKETWDVNVTGTVNVLEAIRSTDSVRAAVIVTSDKCYENREWVWGYRETDPMGGHDPYSASKGATELVVSSYQRSFFPAGHACRLASARAGNVIGGGDWSKDRIVPDFMTTIASGRTLVLRNPKATRPWQHVLEPLSGYLHLAERLLRENGDRYLGGWNFGPADTSVTTVRYLVEQMVAAWGSGTVEERPDPNAPHEAGLLKLDISKASASLEWRSAWSVRETVRKTVDWYRAHLEGADLLEVTRSQITDYAGAARDAGVSWALGDG